MSEHSVYPIKLENLLANSEGERLSFIQECEKAQLKSLKEANFALVKTAERLELRLLSEPKLGGVYVDFISGALAHRRKFGGGRGEAIAKAVGVKKQELPSVLDATAGLGRDAFVLASLGCSVSMLERHSVVRMLLKDGLNRAYTDLELGKFLQEHLSLREELSLWQLVQTNCSEEFDVVYLDPMFPHKQKSALVKKEMRVFQSLVGQDLDADKLLEPALQVAKKRVVVKRPDYAPPLNSREPNFAITTKNHRFDVYVKF